jgi:hypothetical protein
MKPYSFYLDEWNLSLLDRIAEHYGIKERSCAARFIIYQMALWLAEEMRTETIRIVKVETNAETQLVVDPLNRTAELRQTRERDTTSSDSYHNMILAETLTSSPNAMAATAFLESPEAQVLLQRVCDGHRAEWDGHNMIGALAEDAERAWDEIVGVLELLYSGPSDGR